MLAAWWDWLWDVPINGPKATLLLRVMAGSVVFCGKAS